jgi:HPt (histidine-containing phosphotransfer) domain-containing protein
MEGGLKRVAGNKRLYRDLLVQFAAKQNGVPDQISSAIEIGDRKLAERIVHTVKGVAGNIGLGKVFASAEKLERAIHEVDEAVPVLVEEFVLALSRQVEAIQQSMRDAMPDQPAEGGKGSELDVRAATAAIARLRVLLESSDGDAAEAFLSLESAFAGACDKLRMYALGEDISEFNFDSALLKLDEIAKDYGVNWEQAK